MILAGMSANLCVQAHLHELLEQGYEVAVVRDTTAAATLREGDGYLAAIINFRYIANGLWSTDEAVARIEERRETYEWRLRRSRRVKVSRGSSPINSSGVEVI